MTYIPRRDRFCRGRFGWRRFALVWGRTHGSSLGRLPSRSSSCFLRIHTSCSATAATSSKKKGSRPGHSSPSSSSSSFTPVICCDFRVRRLILCASFRRNSFLIRPSLLQLPHRTCATPAQSRRSSPTQPINTKGRSRPAQPRVKLNRCTVFLIKSIHITF
jgi:hypothetical protein